MTRQVCSTCHTPVVWQSGKLVCPKKPCPSYGKEKKNP